MEEFINLQSGDIRWISSTTAHRFPRPSISVGLNCPAWSARN